jgi:hypothetical protein
MELKGEDYHVYYNEAGKAIVFSGTLRLRDSAEYQQLSEMLSTVHAGGTGMLVMDFKNLQFLNSSGINTISKFIINARKADKLQIKILGNKDISWQQKSLRNLQKLWSSVQIELA